MARDADSQQAERVVRELRESAAKLAARSRELVEEAERLRQRADDLAQLIRRHDARQP